MPMSTGARIIEARTEKGWDRAALVKESGVPYSTLAGLEDEHQKTSTATPKLAVALGVNALWLAEGKGPKYLTQQESQPVRWDYQKLSLAHRLLRTTYSDAKKVYSVEKEPEALIELYEKLIKAGDDPALIVAIGQDLSRVEKPDERQVQRDRGAAPAASGKRAARKA